MRLIIRTVLGAILNPVLSSEKYLAPEVPFFVDISIIIINTCNINLEINHPHIIQLLNYFLSLLKNINPQSL
jgi:hypothetical protein